MCTIAWGRQEANERWICFNRDEQRSRQPAEQPRAVKGPRGMLVYPRDPDGGGSWLAVSLRGFAVALLNRYPDAPVGSSALRSRGLLVRDLAGEPDVSSAAKTLGKIPLDCYRSFYLLLLGSESEAGYTWDGESLGELELRNGFLTTSSHDPERIARERSHRWERVFQKGSPGGLAEAVRQLSQPDEQAPALGLAMDREDARTVSQTSILLRPGHLKIRYAPRLGEGEGFAEASWQTYKDVSPE